MLIMILIMGQSASDYYLKQDLNPVLTRKDQFDTQYLWIDLRISGQENKIYLDKFKMEFKVNGEGKVQNFKEYVKGYSNGRNKLRVICAASLPEDVYGFMQNSENIQRALLFCGNKIRAGNLMRDYSKIAKACYSYVQVIKQVKQWQKQPFTSFHFYQPQEIQRLNKFNANLMSLTDSKNIGIKQSKENMTSYLYQFLPNDISTVNKFIQDLNKARSTPQSMASFIKDSLLSLYPKIFNEINYLLKVTTNPKKLAHLRLIINDLFACISDNYLKTQLLQSTFYTVLDINEEQSRRILSKDQYFINTFFLSAETIAPSEYLQLKDHEIKLFIKTPYKQGKAGNSNGFLYYQKKVMFNPGCYFRLEGYDEASRVLTVRLMELVPELKREKERGIYLNKQWMSSLQSKYDGQWLALLFFDPAQAQIYINHKIEAISKEKDKDVRDQSKFKWSLYKQQWNLLSNKLSNIQSAVQDIKPYNESSQLEFTLFFCDLLWFLKKQSRLKAQIKTLLPYLSKTTSKQLSAKIKIYEICDKILAIASNPNALISLLDGLQEIQQSLQKQQCYQLSPVYFLLLTVKIRCLSELNNFNEQLKLIDKMLKIYSICAGRSSPQCLRLNKLKVEVISLKNKEVNDKQAARKAKLVSNCKVKLDDLRDPTYDCVYSVNSSKINLELYN